MGKESNEEGTIRRVGFALAHGGMCFDKQGIRVRWKARESHAVKGTDPDIPLESTIKGRNPACRFARPGSKLMLAWIRAVDNHMEHTSCPLPEGGDSLAKSA
jgi:hypothetical protein